MSHKENKQLCTLININEDACEFYQSAQRKAENSQLKSTFKNLENLHKGVIFNLQNQVRINGGDPEAESTIVGQTQKFWGALMSNISNDVDETLVKHLEEAEDRCLHSIEDAIQSDDVGASTKTRLRNELKALQKSHDYMKALKECMKAA